MNDQMQIALQFGLKKSLDHLFQLIYMSSNLFTSFEIQDKMCFLEIDEDTEYSETDVQKLLTYFLDLVEHFTHERILLIQDSENSSRFAVSGGL
jgi:hypothetical protein